MRAAHQVDTEDFDEILVSQSVLLLQRGSAPLAPYPFTHLSVLVPFHPQTLAELDYSPRRLSLSDGPVSRRLRLLREQKRGHEPDTPVRPEVARDGVVASADAK